MTVTTTDTTNTCFFMSDLGKGLGTVSPSDELLHRDLGDAISDGKLVETQYLGFHIPEANICSMNYLWLHPNLGVMSGGAWAWKGMKPEQSASELFDMREFMSDLELRKGDLDNYTLPCGYHVEITTPLEEMRITYSDPLRENSFDVRLSAVMPPAVTAESRHFDQAMRTSGTLRLRGEDHKVDGFTVRDRSWGEVRPEIPRQAPPIHYLTGVFGEDFAFTVTAIEDRRLDPPWAAIYPSFSQDQVDAFSRGWVWRDGEVVPLASVSLQTTWDRTDWYAAGHRLDIVDADGRSFHITGTVTAASQWYAWSNTRFPLGLIHWECDGKRGSGDSQAGVWTDFDFAMTS